MVSMAAIRCSLVTKLSLWHHPRPRYRDLARPNDCKGQLQDSKAEKMLDNVWQKLIFNILWLEEPKLEV